MKKTFKATKDAKKIEAASKTPLFSDAEIAAIEKSQKKAEKPAKAKAAPVSLAPEKAAVLALSLAPEQTEKTVEKIEEQIGKLRKIKAALLKKPATKPKAWNTPEEQVAFLAKARDAYFKANGLGPYKQKEPVVTASVSKDGEAVELILQLGNLLGVDVKKVKKKA